jgi:hypothetical protein
LSFRIIIEAAGDYLQLVETSWFNGGKFLVLTAGQLNNTPQQAPRGEYTRLTFQ